MFLSITHSGNLKVVGFLIDLKQKNMITKKKAAKFWAEYFSSTEKEALDCNHMTIDCMVKFAEQQLKNCNLQNVSSLLLADERSKGYKEGWSDCLDAHLLDE